MRGSRTHSGYDAVYNWRRLAETQVRVLGPQGAIINICRSSRSENKWQRCVTSDVCCGSLAKQSVNSRGRRSVMKLRIHGCLRNEALIKLPVRWTARHWVDDAIDFISDTQYRWQRWGVSSSLRWITYPIFSAPAAHGPLLGPRQWSHVGG